MMDLACKRMDLQDVVIFIQGKIEEAFPSEWVAFAGEVASLLTSRRMFVERTGDVSRLAIVNILIYYHR